MLTGEKFRVYKKHKQWHILTHSHTHSHTHTQDTHNHTYTLRHTHIIIHKNTQTLRHTHMHIITQKHTHTQTSTNTHISPLHPHFWNDPLCERRAVFAGTKEKCSYRFLENILLHNICDWRCWTVQVKVKRVDPKSSHLMERSIFLFLFFLYLCGVTYVNGAYCGNYCTTHVSQTIIPHTLKSLEQNFNYCHIFKPSFLFPQLPALPWPLPRVWSCGRWAHRLRNAKGVEHTQAIKGSIWESPDKCFSNFYISYFLTW